MPAPPRRRAPALWIALGLAVLALLVHGRTASAGFLGFERPDPLHPFSVRSMAATSVEHLLARPSVEGDEPVARLVHRAAWSLGARRAPDARRFDAWLLAAAAGAVLVALALRLPTGIASFAALALVLAPPAADAVAFASLRGLLAGTLLGALALLLAGRSALLRFASLPLAVLAACAHPLLAALALPLALFLRSGERPVSAAVAIGSGLLPLLAAYLVFPAGASSLPALVALALLVVLGAARAPGFASAASARIAAGLLWCLASAAAVFAAPAPWREFAPALFLALPGLALVLAGLWSLQSERTPGLARLGPLLALGLLAWLAWIGEARRRVLTNNHTLATAGIAARPESSDGWVLLGYDETYHGRLTPARDAFEHANRIAESAPAWTGLGVLLLRIPRLDEAETRFARALELDPSNVIAHHRIGELYQRRGDQVSLTNAVEHLQAALDGAPFFLRARTRLAVCLALLHRTDEADEAVELALAIDPAAREAWLARGMSAEIRGDLQAARAAYGHALELEPDYAEALVSTGRLDLDAGELDAALETLGRAYELHPLYPDVLYQYARALHATGRFADAESFYRKTLEERPGHMRATVELGEVLLAQGRLDEARDRAKDALGTNPNHPGARELLGDVAVARGNWVGAAAQFGAGFQANPARVDLGVRWIRVLAAAPDEAARDGKLALAEAKRLVNQGWGDDPRVLAALAAAQAETGRFAEAQRTIERAIELVAPSDGELERDLRSEGSRYARGEPLRLGESG